MKQFIFIITILFSSFFFSCKKKETATTPTSGSITIKIENQVDGQNVSFNNIIYTNANGNKYSISTLKYYLSNLVFTKTDGTIYSANNYNLIDASDANKISFTLNNIPNGVYNNLKLYIGIDQSHNHSGVQSGDLDPMYGMIWSWNTGYIFFKHEGSYVDTAGKIQPLIFHYGTDAALATAQMPINVDVEGNAKTVYLKFNLNNLYKSPYQINFNQYNDQQSTTQADSIWIVKLKTNFANTFSFDKTE